jgi:outer membrane translocation and assembly module TamA
VTARSLEVGVGGGFRVGLPFGLVRFDLALPAETRVTWKRLQFYAGIGQGF